MGEWGRYRMASAMDPDAAERGRLMAAHSIAADPEVRKRMEDQYGVDFCRMRYPEAYRSGFAQLLDRVRGAIHW